MEKLDLLVAVMVSEGREKLLFEMIERLGEELPPDLIEHLLDEINMEKDEGRRLLERFKAAI